MTIITFVKADKPDSNKGFRIGREQSVYVNNVTFKVTGVEYGSYKVVEDGSEKVSSYANTAQSIRLQTDLGEPIPVSRFLTKRCALYDSDGKARVVEGCTFKAQLREHLEKLGRRADDPSMLKGSVEDVGNSILEFFKNKVVVCHEIEGLAKDKNGLLQPRLSPFIQFEFAN